MLKASRKQVLLLRKKILKAFVLLVQKVWDNTSKRANKAKFALGKDPSSLTVYQHFI